jgi:outer membrane biosynthesis protein TonB
VDSLGNAFSPVIIESSGNADVDAAVLTNFAKNARFEPLKASPRGTALAEAMTFGKLIFEWQTVPPAQTNAPAANP